MPRTKKASDEEEKPKEEIEKEDENKPEEEREEKVMGKAEGMDMEDEDEVEKEEDLSDLDEDEKKMYMKLKRKCRFGKKKTKKQAEEPKEEDIEKENPEEENATATTAGHTITPGTMTGQGQDVFNPTTGISVSREANEPLSQKSATTDLLKSPLFVELSSQLNSMKKSFDTKLDAMEKSVTDRVNNVMKTAEKIEQFYNKPFYKAINENVNPEAVQKKSIAEQIQEGKVRFAQ